MSSQSFQQLVAIVIAIAGFISILLCGVSANATILKESSAAGAKYSFSKFQLWLWSLFICPIVALHWGFASEMPKFEYINSTSLILLAIAGGVTMTASVIKQTQLSSKQTGALVLANYGLTQLKTESISGSHFFSDILSDDSGQLSIGRLQNFIFTLIFVVVYVTYFFQHGEKYIEFGDTSSNVYILMGISSGTYLVGRGMFK